MKTCRMILFFLSLNLVFPILSWADHSDPGESGPGNGGNMVEQEWSALSLELLSFLSELTDEPLIEQSLPELSAAIFQTKIKAQEKVYIKGLDGQLIERDAANSGKDRPSFIKISESRWPASRDDEAMVKKMGIILHEYLGILGIEENVYNVSATLYNKLEAYVLQRSENFLDDHAPILLFQESSSENSPQGFTSLSQAQTTCNRIKRLYEQQYFFVFCTFIGKSWWEEHKKTVYLDDYLYLGQVHANGLAQAEATQSFALAMKRGSSQARASVQGTLSYPVIKAIQTPYEETYETEHLVYGLRVFGLGKFSSSSPYKLILSSLNLLDGLLQKTYPSNFKALLSCKKILFKAASCDPMFYRAKCSVQKLNENQFYFEIKSQNPFLR